MRVRLKKAENVENPYIYIEKDVDGSLYKEVMTEEEFKEYYNSFGNTLLKLTIKGSYDEKSKIQD